MSHADKRSPITDALETLGMIHFKPEARDAIHLAVEPVKAVQDLQPGQRIGIINGEALPAGHKLCLGTVVPYHGIVDPFLPEGPQDWAVLLVCDGSPHGALAASCLGTS